jgi:hypothetical protein
MSLVWLIILALIAYVGLQYVRTFQGMVNELRDMRLTCMGSGKTPSSYTEPAMVPVELKEKFISILNYMKTSA